MVDFPGITGKLQMEKERLAQGKAHIPWFVGGAGAVLSQTPGIPHGSGASGAEQDLDPHPLGTRQNPDRELGMLLMEKS